MPAVVIGTPRGSGQLPAVWQDDRAATETVVGYLAGLGHRRIARVGGFARYWHSKLRTRRARPGGRARRASRPSRWRPTTPPSTAPRRPQDLLKQAEPPTAILYDNDVMAVAGLGAAQRMGVRVPADLSIVAWDDSTLCELVHPALTALRRDIPAAGATAARMLREGRRAGSRINVREAPPVPRGPGQHRPRPAPAAIAAAGRLAADGLRSTRPCSRA